ncbi:gephyrin-like molybdotransferase receptor GlpR [Saccharomonospora piscinae]|uniref:divisome protein SepX/GlpR n=1 Tax=Saccharomonospora piscinae TaxID=687388 RepID=UPI0004655534|nr:gephyrin-like molybdotransferase receptor GlpR [Saccharomonospora piscinae]
MPSSLIIVGLAAAWLAVLVPMFARKRQVITQTNEAALAARVVRSGSARGAARDGADDRDHVDDFVDDERDEPHDEDTGDEWGADGRSGVFRHDDAYGDELDAESEELDGEVGEDADDAEYAGDGPMKDGSPLRRYRPGRGGFDPEAAALAARAKYAFRQRVVIVLLLLVTATAVAAGFVSPLVWWAHGAADAVLVGYLVYLRRQVRIEEEIRQRRMARLRAAARKAPRRRDPLADIEVVNTDPGDVVGSERKPMPTSRVRRQAVVVDLEDEDPAFHDLADPGPMPYRRAVGE